MSSAGAGARRSSKPRRGEPEERREVARPEDRGRQGARRAECAQARYAVAEVRRAAGRRCRRVRRPPGGVGRGAAPVGALQMVLARRVAVAAWRLARADRWKSSCSRSVGSEGGLGLALIRDGNGTRVFETLLRYRGAAMAEFWRGARSRRSRPNRRLRPMLRCRRPRSGRRRGRRSPRRQLPNEPERAPGWITCRASRLRPAHPARARGPVAAERTRERDRSAPCSPEPAAELNGTSDRAQRAADIRPAHFSPIMMRRRWSCHGP